MRETTFARIRAAILSGLAEASGPVHASTFAHRANTDYDRAREVRQALEAEGLIRTFKDMTQRNHPLVTELVTPTVDLDRILRLVDTAANLVAIDEMNKGASLMQMTNRAIRAAFQCALGNGLIAFVPTKDWPAFISTTPPYIPGLPPTRPEKG